MNEYCCLRLFKVAGFLDEHLRSALVSNSSIKTEWFPFNHFIELCCEFQKGEENKSYSDRNHDVFNLKISYHKITRR